MLSSSDCGFVDTARTISPASTGFVPSATPKVMWNGSASGFAVGRSIPSPMLTTAQTRFFATMIFSIKSSTLSPSIASRDSWRPSSTCTETPALLASSSSVSPLPKYTSVTCGSSIILMWPGSFLAIMSLIPSSARISQYSRFSDFCSCSCRSFSSRSFSFRSLFHFVQQPLHNRVSRILLSSRRYRLPLASAASSSSRRKTSVMFTRCSLASSCSSSTLQWAQISASVTPRQARSFCCSASRPWRSFSRTFSAVSFGCTAATGAFCCSADSSFFASAGLSAPAPASALLEVSLATPPSGFSSSTSLPLLSWSSSSSVELLASAAALSGASPSAFSSTSASSAFSPHSAGVFLSSSFVTDSTLPAAAAASAALDSSLVSLSPCLSALSTSWSPSTVVSFGLGFISPVLLLELAPAAVVELLAPPPLKTLPVAATTAAVGAASLLSGGAIRDAPSGR
mmetsp:Transcript_10217/g.25090  ORF Transcript_10217/g.25090 Transcript_10217/m.25090 type:complete len:456 (-) Transcript_10217:1589-2956(-)